MISPIIKLVSLSCMISIVSGYTSTFTSISRSSFLIVTVSHAILASLAVMLYVVYILRLTLTPLLVWSVIIVTSLITCSFIVHVRAFTERELILSTIFALVLSIAALFMAILPGYMISRMWSFLTGSLFMVSDLDISIMFVICLFCSTLFTWFYREFILISYDYDYALATSLRARELYYLLSILISLTTLACVYVLGLFVTYAVLLIPGSILINARVRPSSSVFLTSILVFTTLVLSIFLSLNLNVPPSGLCGVIISIFAGLIILARLVISKFRNFKQILPP